MAHCAGPRSAAAVPPRDLREVGDALAHATAIAAEEGAGTLVYVGRFDLAEFAVVLEPDEPLWHGAPRHLCRLGRARRCAGGACAAGEADRLRLARRDPRRRRAGRRRAARLADRRRRERAAAVAGVRRDDPHRRDGRGGAGPAAALGRARGRGLRRSRLRPAGRELRAPSHESRSTPGRRRASARSRRTIWRGSPPEQRACAREIDENGDLLVRRMAQGRAGAALAHQRAVAGCRGSIPRPEGRAR